MNKIEQMHLDTMIVKDLQSAVRSAEITEQIAVEFADWIGNHSYQKTVDGLWTNNWGISQDTTKELYQEFLKTKQ